MAYKHSTHNFSHHSCAYCARCQKFINIRFQCFPIWFASPTFSCYWVYEVVDAAPITHERCSDRARAMICRLILAPARRQPVVMWFWWSVIQTSRTFVARRISIPTPRAHIREYCVHRDNVDVVEAIKCITMRRLCVYTYHPATPLDKLRRFFFYRIPELERKRFGFCIF